MPPSKSDVLYFRQHAEGLPHSLSRPFRLAVIGNFPPRRCGIATFTADMVEAVRLSAPDAMIDVYAMATAPGMTPSDPVRRWIMEDDPASYLDAAQVIENSVPDAVWLHHEFGIFGGEDGEMVIDLLAPIAAPLIVTLHTILENPTPTQRRILDWFVAHAVRLVVMSQYGAETLQRLYHARPEQVVVIEHGAPDRPFGRSEMMKKRFGITGGKALMTFGLLSPGKGIETAIASLAYILPRFPDTVYIIAGATHPKLVEREGEAYREALKALAESLGVAPSIHWIEDYLDTPELLDLIEAADIYLTPYISVNQSTSGTLSYAVALGKAVVSTPYIHARELLADGNGILIPFGDALEMAEVVCGLLADPTGLEDLQRQAYRRGRAMIWSRFGSLTRQVVESVRVETRGGAWPKLSSQEGLHRLCDDTGMLQHSMLSFPDRKHGYCVDDNARALMLANVTKGNFSRRTATFATFVQHSWNPDTRRFRNFMNYDRSWRENAGSEDSCGRTLWALGATASEGATAELRTWAEKLWSETADIALEFGSPRAIAFAMLGAHRCIEVTPDDVVAIQILEEGAHRLARLLQQASRPGWCWFEPVLAYDNCRLAEALLRTAWHLREKLLAERALETLEWIVTKQTSPAGHFRPVGSEGFGMDRLASLPFDQQPVDAWATVDAAALAFSYTRAPRWFEAAQRAYAWFFGANDRGVPLVDSELGACMDGITPQGVNLNCGAESVLALHMASHTIEALQKDWRDADAREQGSAKKLSLQF